MIRRAVLQDLDALLALEKNCFFLDRISRRSYRYLLTKAKSIILVNETVQAVCIILLRSNSLQARLYSIAVDPAAQGQGLAKRLMIAVEKELIALGYKSISLEVRQDNQRAITLYLHQGYKIVGTYEAYYADQMGAVRMKKEFLWHEI